MDAENKSTIANVSSSVRMCRCCHSVSRRKFVFVLAVILQIICVVLVHKKTLGPLLVLTKLANDWRALPTPATYVGEQNRRRNDQLDASSSRINATVKRSSDKDIMVKQPIKSWQGEEATRQSTAKFLEKSSELTVCRNIRPDEVSYSLVTQCSDDRLWMMEHHCQRWAVNNSMTYISLLVYTNDTLAQVKTKLRNLTCPVDAGMTVLTFPRVYDDKDYPTNYFRNEALATVNTSHAVLLDIDFWPSTNLFSVLNEAKVRSKLAESNKNAMVIPAFQLRPQCRKTKYDCPHTHIPLMPYARDEQMQAGLNATNITAFNVIQNPDGHGSTQYDRWMEQPADELIEIKCVKSNRYEPYLVVRACHDLPPFQPVFTGYGKNKVSWILHLRRLGWSFFQIGQAFITHYPHRDSAAKQNWRVGTVPVYRDFDNTTMFEDSKKSQNDRYFVEFRQWLATSVPNHTRIHKCTHSGAAADDDSALWVNRATG